MPTHFNGTSRQKQALNCFIKMIRATNSVESVMRHVLDQNNLTVSQLGVLESLFHLGPMCQNQIAAKILKSGGNLTTIIDNLEKKKLIERQAKPNDRRYYIIALTPAGKRFISSCFPAHVQAICELFAGLNLSEQKQLEELLKKLGRSIETRREQKVFVFSEGKSGVSPRPTTIKSGLINKGKIKTKEKEKL